MDHGYIKAAAAVPRVHIGNPSKNAEEILALAAGTDASIVVFPELCITGYTCGDLFNQTRLISSAMETLIRITRHLDENRLIVVGLPLYADNQLFNCAAVISGSRILGIVPKTYIPNYNEFYEKRWFSSSANRLSDTVSIDGHDIPFGENLLFQDTRSGMTLGIEICEDLWVGIPPSSYHTMHGANVIANPSASPDMIGKGEFQKKLVSAQSVKCMTGYVYVSAGPSESTTDLVFSGHSLLYDSGVLKAEAIYQEGLAQCLIDLGKIRSDRIKYNSFMNCPDRGAYRTIPYKSSPPVSTLLPDEADPYPFVPKNKEKRESRCLEILNMQSEGLRQRLAKTGAKKAVVGISGGLDSTLALLVTCMAFKKMNLPAGNILGITMPGFGTTGRTYANAIRLMALLGVSSREIPIRDACARHLADIGHDGKTTDITYENAQARERTQILMDTANMEGALVIGTGDLSELALGWCTYNGDHMSMYGVNASVPKTLVRYVVESYSLIEPALQEVLNDICDTPISPELLPPDPSGAIAQKTEDSLGKYDLHDFFLYHMVRNGFGPDKILALAKIAFRGIADENEIKSAIRIFYKRFFSQQFKRSCLPDGPKVGSVCLSPRGDWRMPSDADGAEWAVTENDADNVN